MVRFPIQAIAIGSSLIDLAVTLCVLLRSPSQGSHQPHSSRPRIGAGRVLAAAGAGVASLLVKVVVLRDLGLNAFGAIRLAYLFLVVTLPLTAAAALVLGKLGRRNGRPPALSPAAALLLGAALLGAPIGAYATFVEPFALRVESARVALAPSRQGGDSLRIGVLTDLQTRHVSPYEHTAIERLLAASPDLILLPGDLFQGTDADFERERPALRELLGRLRAPGGVFVVDGDTDQATHRIPSLIEGTDIRFLHDGVAAIEVGDRRVTIGGVGLEYDSPSARRVLDALETDPAVSDIRILLAHRPDAVALLAESSRVDLVVAGHTHGGQIVIPGFGPPMTLSNVPRSVAAGGLHRVGGNAIYVSRGVGCERGQAPRIRLFCPPEVSVLTLSSSRTVDVALSSRPGQR